MASTTVNALLGMPQVDRKEQALGRLLRMATMWGIIHNDIPTYMYTYVQTCKYINIIYCS